MKKIIVLLLLIMIVLTGCSLKKTKSQELYNHLDAKETLEKAVDYFNDNVNYFVTEQDGEGKTFRQKQKLERIKNKGKVDYLMKNYYEVENGEFNILYEICSNGNCESVSGNSKNSSMTINKGSYEAFSNKYKLPFMNAIWKVTDKTNLLDIKKQEADGKIVITYKIIIESEWIDENNDKKSSKSYQVVESYINSDGLIEKEICYSYEDESFKTVLNTYVAKYYDFNKKESFNFEVESKKIKDMEDKSIEDVKKNLEF